MAKKASASKKARRYAKRAPKRYRKALVRRHGAKKRAWLSKFCLAQVDPFHPDIRGVRVPDENTAPSSAFYTYDEVTLTTSTTNAVCSAFFPSLNVVRVDSNNNIGASSWTWQAAYAGGATASMKSSIQNQYNISRPVCHGIRLNCPLAPTAATGYVHVCIYAMNDMGQSTWNLPTSISQLASLPFYRRITLASLTQAPVIIANKFLDSTAFRYTDVASSDIVSSTEGMFNVPKQWCCILVAVENAPSGSTAISYEAITHYEGQSKFGGVSIDSTACAPNVNNMQRTARVVSHTDPVVNDTPMGVAEAVNRAATEFASGIAEAAIPAARAAGAYAGRTIGAAAAGIVGVNAGRQIGYGPAQ